MNLMTKEIERQMPPIGSQQNVEDPLCRVKYYAPWKKFVWYGFEYDPEEQLFYGIDGLSGNLGYFELGELESIEGPDGEPIKRDLAFIPTPISQIQKACA